MSTTSPERFNRSLSPVENYYRDKNNNGAERTYSPYPTERHSKASLINNYGVSSEHWPTYNRFTPTSNGPSLFYPPAYPAHHASSYPTEAEPGIIIIM